MNPALQHLPSPMGHRQYAQQLGLDCPLHVQRVPCELCGGEEQTVLVDTVQTLPGQWANLPVVACPQCGHVQQNPRFERAFYDHYYAQQYRVLQFGHNSPEQDFLKDQVRRGQHLYHSLNQWCLQNQAALPGFSANSKLQRPPRLLDVGCSAGGLMLAFHKQGWQVYGTDPDQGYVRHGRERLGLSIEAVAAEDMVLPSEYFDLIIITGSLEHVYDINQVLQHCRRASTAQGLLLVEGRAWGYGILNAHFSHNHRRYLRADTIAGFMHKHGWQPAVSTEQPWCGPTRPGGVYVLGQAIRQAAPTLDAGYLSTGADLVALRAALQGVQGAVPLGVEA